MNIREDQKRQVQQATDIVRLIGEHVALRPRGKEFIGLCPFHDDKNPSLYVSPAKQIYKCFSCGAGGDVFSFAIGYHKMSFPEALKHLAERAGIKLQTSGSRDQDSEGPSDRQLIGEANGQAAGFFQTLYRHEQHGQVARAYVAKRGISPEMLEAFQIGYASDRWDGLVLQVAGKRWDLRSFQLAGLVMARQNGPGHYDRFRHRLMFPICDAIGRCIAFGGRKLRDEDEPKYLNSPESPLFNKSATLYGLHLAKKPIIDSHVAVVVEGYTDVIACHQAGCRNVVSTLGTALTAQHVAELRRYCEKVVLIYDGDEAGIKAADRAVEVFLTGDLDVAIAVIPDDLDPADVFALPDGVARWHSVLESAHDALLFQFERIRGQMESTATVTGKQKVAEEYLRKLAQLGLGRASHAAAGAASGALGSSVIRQAMVIQRLAQLLHLSEEAIRGILKQMTPTRPASLPEPIAPVAAAGDGGNAAPAISPDSGDGFPPDEGYRIKALQVAERELIGCVLRQPGLFHHSLSDGKTLDEAVTPAELCTEAGRRLYAAIYQMLSDGQELRLAGLLGDFAERGEADLANLATAADAEVEAKAGEKEGAAQALLEGAVSALLDHQRQREYRHTRERLAGEGGGQTQDQILRSLAGQQQSRPVPQRLRSYGH